MRALAVILVVMALAGCGTPMTEYQPVTVAGDPKAIVEQVLMEQPRKFHPDYVRVTDEYVEYGGAAYSKDPPIGIGHSVSRKDVTRMYFKSIAENRLFAKGRWWMVRSVNDKGTLIGEAWTDDQDKAVKYISALEELRRKAVN
jgi:outer membrane PBP1 activator LpoA protein